MNKYHTMIIILLICYSCACPSTITEFNTDCQKTSIVKKKLQLTKKKHRIILKNDSIIKELYISIRDTVSSSLINRRIDSLRLKSYTKKEFFTLIKIDRAFKRKLYPMEINRRIDTAKTQNFSTAEEAAAFHKQFIKSLKKGFNNNKFRNKDSIERIIKDSLKKS